MDELQVEMLLDEEKASLELENIKVEEKLFEIDYSDLKIKHKIGDGAESAVFYGFFHKKEIAFKCVRTKLISQSQADYNQFEKEVKILIKCRHPHIVVVHGATLVPPRVGVVLEYCHNGNVKDFLSSHKDYRKKDRFRILEEVCSGMCYLHGKGVIHRDLKCENILLTLKCTVKICDFGLGIVVHRMSVSKTQKIGTIVKGRQYTEKCDVFSMGILSWEILTNKWNPYGKWRNYNIECKVANDPEFRPKYKSRIPSFAYRLMRRMWADDPEKRPSFHQIQKELIANRKNISNLKDTPSKPLL